MWSHAARDVFFVDGGVRFSYRCSRDKKQNNRRLDQLSILTGTWQSKAEFVLGRVESPGFQHTAVMLGCVEPSEAAPVANIYRNTAHTRRHIPIGLCRSTQQSYWVAWSRAARDGFCGRGCDVLV